jgi:hypothetical protein
MRPNREGKPGVPGLGGYTFEVIEVTGPPDYHMPMPPAKSRGPLIPGGDGQETPQGPGPGEFLRRKRSKVPLVPTAEEIATLPRLAQVAFVARCALRVQPIAARAATVADVARALFEAATLDTPLTAQLRCIRRDFARLKRLARRQKWTDDTPVVPEAFGPLWPPGIAPHWAVETPEPPAPRS